MLFPVVTTYHQFLASSKRRRASKKRQVLQPCALPVDELSPSSLLNTTSLTLKYPSVPPPGFIPFILTSHNVPIYLRYHCPYQSQFPVKALGIASLFHSSLSQCSLTTRNFLTALPHYQRCQSFQTGLPICFQIQKAILAPQVTVRPSRPQTQRCGGSGLQPK
jgi:hypothetical protein